MSFILAVISLCSILFNIIYSFAMEGAVISVRFGAALVLALIFSVIGIVLGVLSRAEADRFRFFPTAGLILNVAIILFLAVLLWIGMN